MSDEERKQLIWQAAKYKAIVDEVPVDILYIGSELDQWQDRNPKILLFRYGGDSTVRAIRWEVGTVINLHTNSCEQAKLAINAMYQMEGRLHGT